MGERIRLVNRFRGLFWRYYPQFGELMSGTVRPWHLELWELAPDPDAPKGVRVSTVRKILKRNGVRRRLDAEEALGMLRREKMKHRARQP